MNLLRSSIVSLMMAALFGCASTETSAPAIAAAPKPAQGSYGYITPTGLVVSQNIETVIDYEAYVGADCIKHLKGMNGFLRKMKDAKCTPWMVNSPDPGVRAQCRKGEIEVAQRQRQDQICVGRRDNHPIQSLYVRAVQPGMTADFVESMPMIAQGRFSHSGGNAAIPLQAKPELKNSKCFMLTNDHGKPVPVRGPEHADRYLFEVPFLTEKSQLAAVSNTKTRVEKEFASVTGQLMEAKIRMRASPAYTNGQCVKPKQRKSPPKPQGMSDAEVQFQANGGCVDLVMRRFDQPDAMSAFNRLAWDDKVIEWKKWETNRGSQNSCGRNLIGQMETAVTDIACGMFFKKHALPGCIQNIYQQCMTTARRACSGPVQAWREQVRRIEAEPAREYASCLSYKRKSETLQVQYDRLSAQHGQARVQTERVLASQTAASRIDLADAVCTNNF